MMRSISIITDGYFGIPEEDIIIFKQFQLEARYLSTEFWTDGGVKYIKSIESLSDRKKNLIISWNLIDIVSLQWLLNLWV